MIARIRLEWDDFRLTVKNQWSFYNWRNTYNNLANYLQDIWHPKIYHSNAIKVTEFRDRTASVKRSEINTLYFSMESFVKVDISCPMNFENFPFDNQTCFWKIRSEVEDNVQLRFTHPTVYVQDANVTVHSNDSSYQMDQASIEYNVRIKPMNISPIWNAKEQNYFTLFQVEIRLQRKSEGLSKLKGNYYATTLIFSLLSLFSFFIKPEVVPGRMGMLVSLFLIIINIYAAVDAPSSRGFSYLEVWFLGILSPTILAITEYAIILALLKFYSGFRSSKTIACIDMLCFSTCLLFLFAFVIDYWI